MLGRAAVNEQGGPGGRLLEQLQEQSWPLIAEGKRLSGKLLPAVVTIIAPALIDASTIVEMH
jgi:hypothetical protein